MSLNIGIILGSTRPKRAGEAVAKWFMEQTKELKEVNFQFIDLQELNLPFLDEPVPPLVHQYSKDHTHSWAKTVEKLDGFIVITPEYNHSFSAVLKNALDFLNAEWNKKPIAFVSYGAVSGGIRAVEQLRLVAIELKMVPIQPQISITSIWAAIDDKGNIKPENLNGDPLKLTEELLWWAKVLKDARSK